MIVKDKTLKKSVTLLHVIFFGYIVCVCLNNGDIGAWENVIYSRRWFQLDFSITVKV